MRTRKVSMCLLLLLSLFILGSCKSTAEIRNKTASVYVNYKKIPIFEYFTQNATSPKSVSSSVTERTSAGNTLVLMQLAYNSEDNKAYGTFSKNKFFNGNEETESNETPIMLDEAGYHVPDGYELTDEIKNFTFMSEKVELTRDMINKLKVEEATYEFELPAYSITYNVKDISETFQDYLEIKGLAVNVPAEYLSMNKSEVGGGGTLSLSLQNGFSIRESFGDYDVNVDYNYKQYYVPKGEAINEQ